MALRTPFLGLGVLTKLGNLPVTVGYISGSTMPAPEFCTIIELASLTFFHERPFGTTISSVSVRFTRKAVQWFRLD